MTTPHNSFAAVLPAVRERFAVADEGSLEADALRELAARLPQLDILFADTKRALDLYAVVPLDGKNEQTDRVRVYAECFYYFGARVAKLLMTIFGDSAKRIGGKTLGVLLVRNPLIEHPEQRNSVWEGAWRMGWPQIVELKVHGQTGADDQGLAANADELHRQLVRLLGHPTT